MPPASAYTIQVGLSAATPVQPKTDDHSQSRLCLGEKAPTASQDRDNARNSPTQNPPRSLCLSAPSSHSSHLVPFPIPSFQNGLGPAVRKMATAAAGPARLHTDESVRRPASPAGGCQEPAGGHRGAQDGPAVQIPCAPARGDTQRRRRGRRQRAGQAAEPEVERSRHDRHQGANGQRGPAVGRRLVPDPEGGQRPGARRVPEGGGGGR